MNPLQSRHDVWVFSVYSVHLQSHTEMNQKFGSSVNLGFKFYFRNDFLFWLEIDIIFL